MYLFDFEEFMYKSASKVSVEVPEVNCMMCLAGLDRHDDH